MSQRPGITPRILLLGCNGNVGWELQRALSPLGELLSYSRNNCDLSNLDQLHQIISTVNPAIIVNAAAYTAVDKAEQERDLARRINTEAVATIADCAQQKNALLVHYSTDYVFDGQKTGWYTETDPTGPQSVYGASKLESEEAIINSGCRHLIFRTSWVFATRGGNFAKTILRLAQERETLRVIADQWGAPTSAELIADISAHALCSTYTDRAPGGLYHLAAAGETNWHRYAEFVIEQARRLGAELTVRNVEAIPTGEYPLPAQRPANSRLSTEKLRSTYELNLPNWQYHVQRMLMELLGYAT
jgi:dTDP-4-dehydrorhamnose reductase